MLTPICYDDYLPTGHLLQVFWVPINQYLIRFKSLRGKPRESTAKIATIELSIFVHLARFGPPLGSSLNPNLVAITT